jgi:hypothetical protein
MQTVHKRNDEQMQEVFQVWLEHPVTRAVFAKLADKLKQYETEWHKQSWNAKPAQLKDGEIMLLLATLRGKHELVESIIKMQYKDVAKYIGVK